jgi:hypothetical protein
MISGEEQQRRPQRSARNTSTTSSKLVNGDIPPFPWMGLYPCCRVACVNHVVNCGEVDDGGGGGR